MGNGQINFNDILRIGKKLFTFYKKWSKKQQQKQHAQQQQQQQQQYHSQPQPNYSQNQGGGGQSPYPPPAVGHAGQQQNAWNQGYQQPHSQPHYGGGGYGAHDGKPTVSLPFSLSTCSLPPLSLSRVYDSSSFRRLIALYSEAHQILSPLSLPFSTLSLSTLSNFLSISLRKRLPDTSNHRPPFSILSPLFLFYFTTLASTWSTDL